MKRLLLTFILFTIGGSTALYAQTIHETDCTMSVEEIQRHQAWDIDHPKSENTRDIAIGIFAELAIINDHVNNGSPNDISANLQAIVSYIESADELGMNYTMFETDLTFIETLN